MATKDERPGLLSKVAMFVRNPTKDWSELDQPQDDGESAYDKQALKAMIERKRQNDFVRKREFDQLRKLRNRDPAAMANMARPSYFQSSLPSDADGRAVTLKKIDEIEAQMSKQWWKGKQDAAGAQSGSIPVAQSGGDSDQPVSPVPAMGPSVGQEHFEPTEVIPIQPQVSSPDGEEFMATTMGPGSGGMLPPREAASAWSADMKSGREFSTTKLFAIASDELATDPELEEAAIRFANGDDAGAESGLLSALRGNAIDPQAALSWAGALLDLYRATNQHGAFGRALEEFAPRFGKEKPQWASLADAPRSVDSGATGGAATAVSATADAGRMLWDCPAELNLQGMEALRNVLSSSAMPWHIGWSQLRLIDAGAMPLLDALFSSLCEEPVTLRLTGAELLVQRLRAMTPSGDRTVQPVCWQVRLNALRALGLQDEFELAALDYCVTHEVAPPAWEDARCRITSGPAEGLQGYAATQLASPVAAMASASTVPMGLHGDSRPVLELRGDLLGDVTSVLAALDQGQPAGSRMVVGCQGLCRVDFSAAGSILNWVAQRQSQGLHVQFRDVQRLVAAFFNVIGINEHANVVPRSI